MTYKLRSDWTQRDAEAFFRARATQDAASDRVVPSTGVELNGETVRIAAAAGLIDGLTPEMVYDLRPAEVLRLAKATDDALREAFDLSGE